MKLVRAAARSFDGLLSVILPEECRVCGARECELAGGRVCEVCWACARLFDADAVLCRKCCAPAVSTTAQSPADCAKCRSKNFDSAIACGPYEGALAASIVALKTHPQLPQRLRERIAKRFSEHSSLSFDVVVPVPLSKKRLHERGFNQAEILASFVGKHLKIPVETRLLTRSEHTAIHRVGMDEKARELSVQKAFEMAETCDVAGKKFLLVDDVLTSGATADACALILKKRGASSVTIFTIARAVLRT